MNLLWPTKPSGVLRQLACIALACCAFLTFVVADASENPVPVPPPRLDGPSAGTQQSAVLAGGCFWGTQAVFEHLRGVTRVVSGYSGGDGATADYEAVSTGRTGHAESVQITFDPREVSYGQILQVFFSVAHDPTQLNRQGPDTGSQYRSVIFYADEPQKRVAEAYIAQLNEAGSFPKAVVTRVDPFRGFYPAERYHQDFLIKNPTHPYIVVNDLPKVRNFQRMWPALYRSEPVTVMPIDR
jgi:peptide-methionine (S)-S-oxide reductase